MKETITNIEFAVCIVYDINSNKLEVNSIDNKADSW